MTEPRTVSWPRFGFARLIDALGCKTGAEIGVHRAEFSYYLLAHSNLQLLHAIDPWSGHPNCEEDARSILSPFGNRVRIWRGISSQTAKWFHEAGRTVDFCYVDGLHTHKGVEADMEAWWPLTNICLAGHDYIKTNDCRVVRVVNHWARRHDWQLYLTSEPHWRSWFFLKKQAGGGENYTRAMELLGI